MTVPDTFVTARLAAERLRPEHEPEIHRMHQDPVQMATLGGVKDEAWTAAYMKRHLEHWDQRGFGVWLLRDRVDQAVAGRVLLRPLVVDGVDEVEVGYSFYPAWWGRGLATEAATAGLEIARDTLRLPSLVALTSPTNEGSQRVLTKIGMRFDREVAENGLVLRLFRVTFAERHAGT